MPITPDTKDWTWVLREPCPECGFDARLVSRDELSRLLRERLAVWTGVLERPDAAERRSENVWSPLEYACHLRDALTVLDGRLQLMLSVDGPTFPNWDQDATAIEERYESQDPRSVAPDLASAAARFTDRLDGVEGDQWQRSGWRSDGARFTVETLALYALHEPVHHLVDIGS